MVWVKIANGIYEQRAEKIIRRVNIKDLYEQLESIEKEIRRILDEEFLRYPDNASDEVKQAIDAYNEMTYGPLLADLECRKQEIIDILKELGEWNGT